MFIANAKYLSIKYGNTTVKICTENEADTVSELDPDKDVFCLRYDHPLADQIMKIAASKQFPATFNILDDHCTLLSYSYNKEERKYNRYRDTYVVETKKLGYTDEIIVYTGHCRCPKCYSMYAWKTIENICGIVPLEKGGNAKIDLQRCNTCRNYFIDKQSLNAYEKRYGRLRIYRVSIEDYIRRYDTWEEGAFAEDSILSRNGYLAKYSDAVRHRALICMMENGITKAEIKNKLTEFIELRGERCHNAVIVWQEDLQFVNQYKLEREQKVRFIDRG